MNERVAAEGAGALRIDRWLFAVRLFKSRSLAAQAVAGGKVHINGERAKPSRPVREGDQVTFMRGAVAFECKVTGLPLRRGPASEAARCYEETPESRARREQFAERMRVAAALAPRPEERPDKHDRKELRRLRGR
jgi:ribosome-associated heat shock protein Hsp15